MLNIDIITIFPGMFSSVFSETIIKRAQDKKLVKINVHDLRDYTSDRHRTVDDTPYGGGPGMVLKPEPIFKAVGSLRRKGSIVIMLNPQGERMTQKRALDLSCKRHIILICGRYEGVDERVRQNLVDLDLSIGDYVLSGGELPAMILVDVLVRLVPGVLGNSSSVLMDSFSNGILDYPQYTRPSTYRGMDVPEVLLSGDHARIDEWRRKQALANTLSRRPDLLNRPDKTKEKSKRRSKRCRTCC